MQRPISKSNVLILAVCLYDIVRCQYQTFGENLVLNKPAYQSSTLVEHSFMFNASLGVDGKISTNLYSHKTCSHTNARQTSAWWTVDLKGFFFIKFIRIYQLTSHKMYSRLDGSKMYVRVEDSSWQHIQFNSNWPPAMFDVTVTLDKRISSIKLNNTKLTATTHETFISICELEAYEVLACFPFIVRNGRVQVVKLGDSKQNFTYGTQLNVTCETGYQLFEDSASLTEADSIIECMGTKMWSRNLTCSVIHCGQLKGLPGNSIFTSQVGLAGKTSYNTTVTIQCNAGFRYTNPGRNTVRCTIDGKWSSIQGTCEVIHCGQLKGLPGNSTFTSKVGLAGTTSYNATVTIQCNTGFRYTHPGNDTVRCTINGNWSTIQGTCEVIHCGQLKGLPGNSTFTSKVGLAGKTSYNTTVTIQCNAGFRYTNPGRNTVRCTIDGKWSSIQGTCEVIHCGQLKGLPGNSTFTSKVGLAGTTSYNATVTIQCNTGFRYTHPGNDTVRCTINGNWSTIQGTCEVIHCGQLKGLPGNSTFTSKVGLAGKTSYNTTVTIQCNAGFRYTNPGRNTVRCTIDGKWSSIQGTCEVIHCGQLKGLPGNSTFTSKVGLAGTTSYNATVTIQCNTGFRYTHPGNDTVRCTINGNWSTIQGTCEVIHCGQLKGLPGNSTFTSKVGLAGNTSYNTTVTIQCNAGFRYTHPGNDTVRCTIDGNWSTTHGTCEVINCDESIQNTKHGSLIVLEGIKGNISYNTSVSMICEDGYHIQGRGLVRCNSSGHWEGDLGTCSSTLRNEQPESNVAGVAGGVAAAACLVMLGVIIGFILYKRRTRGPDDTIVDTALTEIPSASQRGEHKEEDITERSIYAEPKETVYPKQDPECGQSKNVYMNSIESSKEYYSFTEQNLTDKHSIRVEDLLSFFVSRKMQPNLYDEEYNNFPDGLTKPHKTALLPQNRSKNRYKEIYPYEETRVILDIWDPSNESDYINACYINGFKTFHKYIAAQGPTRGILNDFWRMIWQTKCNTIVMLTNLIEEGKHKCEQYWPDEGSVEYGDIVIRLIQCKPFSDFTIRTLSVGKTNGKSKGGKTETHQICQFHFTAWPDRGVPRFASSLVHFHQKIRAAQSKQQAEGPMVVHCSAGIGRTGTFLALDYLLEQADELGYINVVKCVATIRKQRVNLVQTLGQYIFLHEALLEALTCTTLAVSTREFQETHKQLIEMDNWTRKRMLDDEFQKLPIYVSDPEEDVYENAKNTEHRHKNRYSNILPDKNHCPSLNVYVKGRDSYINAVFLPAYKENNIFIITQTPLENTIVDFWRMVYQFDVGSIVMLNTLSEMKEEERYWTEDKNMLEMGPFRITLESKSCDDISTNYTMLLHYNDERRRVRLSRATYWADEKPVPMSPTAMLKQIDLIEKWQQESGSKPIIVHCMHMPKTRNGAERSGLFCVIAALLERTKIEQDVAVEQIIKQMRSRRPQIIPNVDQFRFCYDAMLAYLNTFDTYSNFT